MAAAEATLMMGARPRCWALAAMMWTGCSRCGTEDPSPSVWVEPEDTSLHDVLLVTIDTVRADRVGCYGYPLAQTPTLDALAQVGRRYDRAYAPVPLTLPSHATMLTGLEPWNHGVRGNGEAVLEARHDTLAEIFQRAGYATGASVAAFVTSRRWGLDQGFDAYHDRLPVRAGSPWRLERPAEEVVDDALAWLSTVPPDQPRFLWVHLYDAHHPWEPPERFIDPEDPRPYDGEIAYLDEQIARLLPAFDDRPAVISVVADHGESLGEHDELEHGLFVYEVTQRVPWILVAPGVGREVVPHPTPLADVMPTLLDLAGLPVPEGIDGRVERPDDAVVGLSSWVLPGRFGVAPHLGVVQGRYKLIDTPIPALFDVVDDPSEQHNLLPGREDLEAALRARIPVGLAEPPATSPMGGSVSAQLEALGYVAGEVSDLADLPDPSTRRDLIRGVGDIDRLRAVGEEGRANRRLKDLARAWPDVLELRLRLASGLAGEGRLEEALAVLSDARQRWPDRVDLQVRQAAALGMLGREEEAVTQLTSLGERAEGRVARPLAIAAVRAKDPPEAVALGERWLARFDDEPELFGAHGVSLMVTRRADEAWPFLERGLTAFEPPADLHFWLSARAGAQGDHAQALWHLRQEVTHHPSSPRVEVWARHALRLGAWSEAEDAAEGWVVVDPDEAQAWWVLGLARFNRGDVVGARTAVDRGLGLDPDDPDLLLMDANLLAKEGDPAGAQRRFREAQEAHDAREDRGGTELPSPGQPGPGPGPDWRGAWP